MGCVKSLALKKRAIEREALRKNDDEQPSVIDVESLESPPPPDPKLQQWVLGMTYEDEDVSTYSSNMLILLLLLFTL